MVFREKCVCVCVCPSSRCLSTLPNSQCLNPAPRQESKLVTFSSVWWTGRSVNFCLIGTSVIFLDTLPQWTLVKVRKYSIACGSCVCFLLKLFVCHWFQHRIFFFFLRTVWRLLGTYYICRFMLFVCSSLR